MAFALGKHALDKNQYLDGVNWAIVDKTVWLLVLCYSGSMCLVRSGSDRVLLQHGRRFGWLVGERARWPLRGCVVRGSHGQIGRAHV